MSSIQQLFSFRQYLRPALTLFILMTVVTGVLYPLAVTAVAQIAFPAAATGSLVKNQAGEVIGSALLGQSFARPEYFAGRPSATSPVPGNAGASSGSNLAPTNAAFVKTVSERAAALRKANPQAHENPPIDLVTASASGLDPDISVEGALYQAERVAGARELSIEQVKSIIAKVTKERQFGIFGERRVNVLELNLALDKLKDAR